MNVLASSRWTAGWLLFLLFASVAATSRADDEAARTEFFESRIRPLLAEQCYECHNSADTAEGGLSLDWRDAVRKGGDSGPTIVPGQPAKSLLLKVVRHEIVDLEMPSGGPKLDGGAIADLERWIRDGAVDPRTKQPSKEDLAEATSWEAKFARRRNWWSFRPIAKPDVPAVGADWSSHPVDRFLLAAMQPRGLSPAPPADAATLVRRYYYTLIGLPPTPAEVERWTRRLAEDDPAARDEGVGELVDELLASPHFAERWARHWMDWIRYAESHGSEGDPEIGGAWQYRDYLIRALDADVPYDQLLSEHVAGDLLPNPRIDRERNVNESLIGTAHWRMVFHGFAPTDALDERVRFTDDQINAFSKAFLGLTVSCARCHDHKFDAISQRDYYALYAVLNSCRPGRSAIETEDVQRRNLKELQALKPRIRTAIAKAWLDQMPSVRDRLVDARPTGKEDPQRSLLRWIDELRKVPADKFAETWNARAEQRPTNDDPRVRRWQLSDPDVYGTWYRTGVGLPNEPAAAGEFSVATEGKAALASILPAGAYSRLLSSKHAARLSSPDVDLTNGDGGKGDFELWVLAGGQNGATSRYAVHDYPRNGTVYPVTTLGDWKWHRYDLTYWGGESIHVELTTAADAPLLTKNQARSWFGVREVVLQPRGGRPPSVDREFLASVLALAEKQPPRSLDEALGLVGKAISDAVGRWRGGKATDADALLLDAALHGGLLPNDLESLPEVAPLVAEYRKLEAAVPVPTRVPTLVETRGEDQPLFERGNHRKPGELVPRRFLEAFGGEPYTSTGSGRLELAEDLLADRNPLVRRVIVNRLWHHAFGAGLVRTPDNLGRLGDPPSHPKLLDWMATRFAEDGWSLKRCLKLMVTSRTWQATARPPEEAKRLDPDNRLLSHANLRRLEAEAIRDGLLATAGVLDRTRFGPPVDGNSNRRSVYVRVRRNSLDPFLRTFDFPEPFSSTGRRDATNVPAQSLLWMNDARVHVLASAWTRGLLSDASLPTDADRVRTMFETALGREPTDEERTRMLAYLNGADEALARTIVKADKLRTRIADERAAAAAIVDPVRERLLAERRARDPKDRPKPPRPLARWDFDDDARDAIGSLHATLHGGARIENGMLVLDGRRAHALTGRLDRDLTEKTLEAWVQLDNLTQRGGGVVSVETPNGSQFDAIVFGEQKPGEWLAGSDFFRRTKPLGGPAETDAAKQTVHVALVYGRDGTITAYRSGKPYGKPYESQPQKFQKGNAIVGFGVRHLPATGNRMLAGRIDRAQLHARALSANEIAASAGSSSVFVSEEDVLAALTPRDRNRHAAHVAALAELEAELTALGPVDRTPSRDRAWKDLALAIFSLKEFVHLR